MNRIAQRSFVLVAAVLATGCVAEFEQSISVRVVSEDGAPVPGVALRYYSERECQGKFETMTTAGSGEGSLIRSAFRGRLYVVLERPSLCFERKGTWQAAWQRTIDPANEEQFVCTVASDEVVVCKSHSNEGGT
jgi:hypothetical protein